jgi:uncharacterized pyridoxamine 5'-phosphate oxidase family protein
MEEMLAILNDQPAIGYLATVDNGKSRVRPWAHGQAVTVDFSPKPPRVFEF